MQQSTAQSQTVRKNLYDFISRMNVQPNARSSSGCTSAPISSNILQLCSTQPQSDPVILNEQNENLRVLVANLTKTINEPPLIIERAQEPLRQVDMQHVIERNNGRIRQLEELICRQKAVIDEYQRGFTELQSSISNLQTLDADIYKRLSTHDSNLHNRVYELRRALHSGAPYERLMRMIQDIHH